MYCCCTCCRCLADSSFSRKKQELGFHNRLWIKRWIHIFPQLYFYSFIWIVTRLFLGLSFNSSVLMSNHSDSSSLLGYIDSRTIFPFNKVTGSASGPFSSRKSVTALFSVNLSGSLAKLYRSISKPLF